MFGVELRACFGNHHRNAHFTKIGVRHANQRTFGHARHVVDVALDFSRIDVVATADDEVFAAPHDGHVAAFVNFAHIASFEETIGGEFFFGFFGHAPIARKHIGAFDLNATNLAHGQVFACIVLHTQLHIRQGKSNRAATAFCLVGVTGIGLVRVRGEHDGFAHAVTLQDGVSGSGLPFFEGLDQQRGRAGNEQTHVRGLLAGQAGLGQHAHIQGGHSHENGGLRHFGNGELGIKLGHPNHFAAIEQGPMNGHKQTMHMKNGQGMNQHIARLPTPVVFEHLRVAQQIAVRQHGAFAASGGAAGVQNSGQVIGLGRMHHMLIGAMHAASEQAARAVVVQGEDMLRSRLERNFADPTKIFAAAHHHGRFGVANEVLDFCTLVGRVQRQENIASAQCGEVEHHGFYRFFNLHGHA